MVQNTLKQQARSFMEKHDVPYATALRAVDEPLHELRDLNPHSENDPSFPILFRAVPAQGNYGDVAKSICYDSIPYAIRELGLSHFDGIMDFIEEAARRSALLKAHSLESFWEYRVLSRAGLLGADAPELEPFFHYYEYELGAAFGPMYSMGQSLGLFPVNMSSFLAIDESYYFIPVTLDQLEALSSGDPAGPIELSPRGEGRSKVEPWTDSYSILATSRSLTALDNPKLSILFKGHFEELEAELKRRGLKPSEFSFRDISDRVLQLREDNYTLRVYLDDRILAFGSAERLLLWGTECPVKPTILEVAESIGAKFKREADGTLTRDSENKISTACPFHEDVDSFIIYPEVEPRGIFGCYSCGRNGGPERLQLEWDNPHVWDEKPTRPSAATESGS